MCLSLINSFQMFSIKCCEMKEGKGFFFFFFFFFSFQKTSKQVNNQKMLKDSVILEMITHQYSERELHRGHALSNF